MSEPLKCAECGVEILTADADDIVKTDAGPIHRECFDGPVPPPAAAADLLADEEAISIDEENEARRDNGDPLMSGWPGVDYDKADIDMQRLEREDREQPLDRDPY